MNSRNLSLVALLAVLMVLGCNIFGPFHSEGESDDQEVLLADGEAALADDDPAKAIEYAEKGLAKDPNHVDLLYLHARATIQYHNIDITHIIDIMQEGTEGSFSSVTSGQYTLQKSLLDTTFFFDLPPEELERFHAAFPQVLTDVGNILDQIIRGEFRDPNTATTTAKRLGDVYLSAGISSMVLGSLFILDNDTTWWDFTKDEHVTIARIGADRYQVTIEDAPPETVRAAILRLLREPRFDPGWYPSDCFPSASRVDWFPSYWESPQDTLDNLRNLHFLELGREFLRIYYLQAQYGDFWYDHLGEYGLDRPEPPYSQELPFAVDDSAAGEMLEVSHRILVGIWEQAYP